MKIAGRICNFEHRLEVHVQRGMAQWGHIDERGLSVGSVQGQREIDGDRGRAVSALRVDD